MIISDRKRFVFVHIPKCAGISVKRSLGEIDDYSGHFRRIADHPALGRIHYAHITLADLEQHFPDEFAKLRDYASLALVRDPIRRFVSAMNQRLREFKGNNQSQITAAVIEEEAGEVMQYLSRTSGRLDLEFVHFNRQVDYVDLRGERIVRDIFPVDRMKDAFDHITVHTGLLMDEERKNRTTEIRLPGLKPVLRLLRRPYAAILPQSTRERVRAGLVRAGIYGDVRSQALVRPGSSLEGFIRDYYAADVALHASVRGTPTALPDGAPAPVP